MAREKKNSESLSGVDRWNATEGAARPKPARRGRRGRKSDPLRRRYASTLVVLLAVLVA